MHSFNVFHNDLQFKACSHAYKMQFIDGTTIKDRDFLDIPQFEYLFKKFGEIFAGNFQIDLLVGDGDFLTCTLWESHAIKFLNCYNNQSTGKPMMMILTHARVKEGQGILHASTITLWFLINYFLTKKLVIRL
ncbi:hypothetical protein Lalb_Chr13g0293751 [Lupinus albus]|uniref:DUF223 domain-containing protein n=1 Tax=Lupinus albus TaxID=3870 RepID=A0A6A4PHV5_LUPAL|nr:hypothetical protein Lalb_Chr13g0293751 [Lupinus albus]